MIKEGGPGRPRPPKALSSLFPVPSAHENTYVQLAARCVLGLALSVLAASGLLPHGDLLGPPSHHPHSPFSNQACLVSDPIPLAMTPSHLVSAFITITLLCGAVLRESVVCLDAVCAV